ncbi:MFS transporter, partial [Nocardioides sp.]|uniref:MFS transporter n=1 Tax=Nocardioides sp. TaxID=35761 RepID=UPI00286E87D8
MTDTTAVAPVVTPEEHKRLRWALVLISLAQLMVVLDSTIANIALPFIGRDLDISQANLQWIVTGYALAFGGLLLLGGRLGDLYGRRAVFMAGVSIFAVASLTGGLAQNEAMLLTSRAFQGLGAALASPAALALITTTFPAGKERNRAFAVYAMMSGAGAAVGLILGGWLTGIHSLDPFGVHVDGWRLTFLIVVPIGLVAAALAPRYFEESERHSGELDIPGAITGTLGLLGLVFGFSRAGQAAHGWGDPVTIASLAAGVALLAIFAVIESRVEHPLLPIRIFANQTRAASFAAMMLMPAAMFSMFFFLSLYIQNIMGYSPLKAGVAFLPFSVGIVISATIVSNLVGRIDPRFIAGIGTLMASSALFGFSRL